MERVQQISPAKMKRKRSFKTVDSEFGCSALLTCMDYLHGDVVDNEFEAACYYEYARESVVLCEAARLWAIKKYSHEESEEIALAIEKRFPGGVWWSLIWQCPSFPRKSWNQLSQRERANILQWVRPNQIQPLRVDDVWLLIRRGILDQVNTMAAKVTESYRLGKPQRKVYPIIEGPIIEGEPNRKKARLPWVDIIFTLDFGKTRKRLVQEFDKWLQLSENKARFDAHRQNPIGRTGAFKDRLKDLAGWRLYRELGCDKALAFAEKNRKQDKHGKPRQFHDARKEQSKTKMPLNEAPLYSEESGFLKAKARATAHIAKLIPWEFSKFAEDAAKLRNEVAEVFRVALKQARKISKGSS